MGLSRRTLLRLITSGTFFATAGRSTGGLAKPKAKTLSQNGAQHPASDDTLEAAALTFPQGVASADPQPDAVMLWTRAAPLTDVLPTVPLTLHVSESETFDDLILEVELRSSVENDYTVRIYIDGLQPSRTYYYRFFGGADTRSRIGRTRTAPAPAAAERVNLAFASCQSYEHGYYGSWARMLADDVAASATDQIHCVLHLGDFIYERRWNTRLDGSALTRSMPDFPDGITTPEYRYATSLADYRHLYKVYLSDPHLQAARARWPFVCVWDDHEFSDDNFQSYTTYENAPKFEPQRKLNANQSWFEYIPTVLDELREQPAHNFIATDLSTDLNAKPQESANQRALDSLCIYRRLRWGKNLDIVLTDNRSYRSEPCVPETLASAVGLPVNSVKLIEIADAGRAYNNGNPPKFLPYGDGKVPNPGYDREPGTILGEPQREWMLETLQQSDAKWKLWGNSLPLLPMRLDLSSVPFSDYEDGIFNIDGWAGFPHEFKQIMGAIEQAEVTGLVSLSGDHHMHGAGSVNRDPSDNEAPALAVDFNVTGISSSQLFEDLVHVAKTGDSDFQALVYRESSEGLIPAWNMTMIDGSLPAYLYTQTGLSSIPRWLGPNPANPGLTYVDVTSNGYGLATFNDTDMSVQLVSVDMPKEAVTSAPKIRYIASFRLPLWSTGEQPALEGPTFKYGAPFPYDPPTT